MDVSKRWLFVHKWRFLKSIAITLLGRLENAAAADKGAGSMSNSKRVIVIGAGIAGLAAASELQAQGCEVVVVEGRDRVGGRVWTSHKWDDNSVDLGASWIHGVRGNPLTEMADKINAVRLVTRYDSVITYDIAGKPLNNNAKRRLAILRDKLSLAIEQAQEQEEDISLLQAIQPIAREFKGGTEEARLIDFILSSDFEQEYSGSTARLSAHWFDDVAEFKGDDVLFARGFETVTKFLAQDLDIRLGQVVREVRWEKRPIRAVTEDTQYEAEHVVVTLPLGVLQAGKVLFTPDLPKRKAEAIAELGVGVLNKCYLRFTEPFWPPDVDWLEYISYVPGAWTQWVSLWQVAKQPVLLGFNAADWGQAIESLSDEEIVASAMGTLKTIYGEQIPEPIDFQLTRWATDPFALGSYSFNAVGSTPRMRKMLAAPLDNSVFFAGEATHPAHFGTVHGAYLSGLVAARKILAT